MTSIQRDILTIHASFLRRIDEYVSFDSTEIERDVNESVNVSCRYERKRHDDKFDGRKVYHYPEAGVGLSNRRRVYSVIIASDSRQF